MLTTSLLLASGKLSPAKKNLVNDASKGGHCCEAVTLKKVDTPSSWMAVKRHLVNSLDGNASSRSALRAFLISTDPIAARGALLLILNLGADLRLIPELRQNAWRSDLLNDGIWYASSIDAAIAADVIVVSVNRRNEITPLFRRWMRDCLSRKSAGDAVLVTLASVRNSTPWPIPMRAPCTPVSRTSP